MPQITPKKVLKTALHPALARLEELTLHFGCYTGMEDACERAPVLQWSMKRQEPQAQAWA